jgi:transcriptional repressor NrdR
VDCPACHSPTRVLETRREDRGAAVKRRRECSTCGDRFTTFERRERPPLFVVKRGGRRERFDADKLRDGMLRAAYKRPVTAEQIDSIAERIEAEVEAAGGELDATRIGEMCLTGLGDVDRVSYAPRAAVERRPVTRRRRPDSVRRRRQHRESP